MDTRFAASLDSTRIAFDVNGAGTPILLLPVEAAPGRTGTQVDM
jgi:hypothetical protein